MLRSRALPLPIVSPTLPDYACCDFTRIYGSQIVPSDCQQVFDDNVPPGASQVPYYLKPGSQPASAVTLPFTFSQGVELGVYVYSDH